MYILEQYVWPFLQSCTTLLILVNTQRISGQNWIEPLESTTRIIIEIWREHPTPHEFFIQKSQPLLSPMKLFKIKKKKNLHIVNSNWRKSPWSDSFSWCSGSVWYLWYIISSHIWSKIRHSNLYFWRKTLFLFFAKTL